MPPFRSTLRWLVLVALALLGVTTAVALAETPREHQYAPTAPPTTGATTPPTTGTTTTPTTGVTTPPTTGVTTPPTTPTTEVTTTPPPTEVTTAPPPTEVTTTPPTVGRGPPPTAPVAPAPPTDDGLPFTGFHALLTLLMGALIGGSGVVLRWTGEMTDEDADEGATASAGEPVDFPPAPWAPPAARVERPLEHFVFVPGSKGSTMVKRRGAPPAPESELVLPGFADDLFVVARVGPVGGTVCAYLEPLDAPYRRRAEPA